jgi:hypothetical protein
MVLSELKHSQAVSNDRLLSIGVYQANPFFAFSQNCTDLLTTSQKKFKLKRVNER